MRNRYTPKGDQSEFEPGSRGRVLRNLLGIRQAREMEQAESLALFQTTQRFIDETAPDHIFTAVDVRRLHRDWLGGIYPWAGEYRSVNIAKGDFMFAAATQIPALMERFEQDQLRTLTRAELPPLTGRRTRWRYIAAIHAALGRDYGPMEEVFGQLIATSQESAP